MRYITEVAIISDTKTPDGLGGFTVDKGIVGYFMAHKSPVRASLMLKQYGLTTSKAIHLVTPDTLALGIQYFEVDDTEYKLVESVDYTQYKILVLDEVV